MVPKKENTKENKEKDRYSILEDQTKSNGTDCCNKQLH